MSYTQYVDAILLKSIVYFRPNCWPCNRWNGLKLKENRRTVVAGHAGLLVTLCNGPGLCPVSVDVSGV